MAFWKLNEPSAPQNWNNAKFRKNTCLERIAIDGRFRIEQWLRTNESCLCSRFILDAAESVPLEMQACDVPEALRFCRQFGLSAQVRC